MEHPGREELIGFVYGELAAGEQAEVARHVEACGECREQIDSWREVRGALATWKLPERRVVARRTSFPIYNGLKWAAAAIVFITTGFAIARLTAPEPNLEALRADVQQQVSAQLAQHAAEQSAAQRAFLRQVDSRIGQLEQQRLADYRGLRNDVETVALQTQEAFVRLTGATTEN
jgi:anti-sigma factor RsiW